MYGELYQYLILHKHLAIPGIGIFQLERNPADLDFTSKIVNPPSYSITLHHSNAAPSGKIFSWLSEVQNISESDALIRFNDFTTEMKNKIMTGEKLQWEGIGTLSKGLAGEIRFEAAMKGVVIGIPVSANKVIRPNEDHPVRVGEANRMSTEMKEYLSVAEQHSKYWWAAALITGLIAFVFIAWYFSTYGLTVSSAGNRQALSPLKEASTYVEVP